MQENFVFELG